MANPLAFRYTINSFANQICISSSSIPRPLILKCRLVTPGFWLPPHCDKLPHLAVAQVTRATFIRTWLPQCVHGRWHRGIPEPPVIIVFGCQAMV
jgi:hypothetical protein